jgi:glycosyltransferase involved in cell wall biosynthesis
MSSPANTWKDVGTPIKLLQIVNSLHAGGMENIVVEVCNRLDPARFAVTVCCLEKLGAFAGRLRPEVMRQELDKTPAFRWRDVRRLRELIREGAFDVVHTHHLGGLIHVAAARSLSRKPRIVHSEHIILHDWELQPRRLWQRRLLYQAAAWCVFTVSGQQLAQLRQLRLHHRRMFTLHNGVDLTRFRPAACRKAETRARLGLPTEGFFLGKVARFATAKRHGVLIEAFEKAATAHPGLKLLLVGDGGIEREKVLAHIHASPHRKRIHLAGLQSDPIPWYQAMDVLVSASENEGLPNAVLEGMACGLPVLANEACGVRELATDGEHGWIGDYTSADRLAEALVQAAIAPAARLEAMGAAASDHARRNFSIEAMLEKYERLYTAVAEGNREIFDFPAGKRPVMV